MYIISGSLLNYFIKSIQVGPIKIQMHCENSVKSDLLLLIYCFMYLQFFVVVLCWSLLWYALIYVLSSFEIIMKRKRELVALLLLSFGCLVTVNVL